MPMGYWKKFKVILNPRLTMANLWDETAKVYGDGIVAYLEDPLEYRCLPTDRLSYVDNLFLVNKMANVLKEAGVRRGDRVVISMGNRVELLTLCYSCFKIGAIAVPLNYMLKGSEIRYITENCGAKVLVTDRDVFDPNISERSEIPGIDTWIMAGSRDDCLEGFISLDEMMDHASENLEPVRLHKDETVAIFYTSGTTGYPKGAMMTGGNLLTTQRITAGVLPVGEGDLGVSALPSAHLMGFAVALISFMAGAAGYFMHYFQPSKVLQAIQDRNATIFVGVPAMYSILLHANPDDYDLSSMKIWASGADAMPVEHIKKFLSFGGIFFEAYGQADLETRLRRNSSSPGENSDLGRELREGSHRRPGRGRGEGA